MLDTFLKVAYEQELTKQANSGLEGMLAKLPAAELRKLADGTPAAELYKRAWGAEAPAPGAVKAGEFSFLDHFKGTPLFDQAMALEQEELQLDMLQQQRDEERRAEGDVWQMRDKLRLKKRLLELTLAKQESGGAPAAPLGEPAQGAGAPGPVPAEGVQDDSQGLGGGVAKTAVSHSWVKRRVGAAVRNGAGEDRVRDFQNEMGRTLARHRGPTGRVAQLADTANRTAEKALGDRRVQEVLHKKASLGEMLSAEALLAFADGLGRDLARQDLEKAAHAQSLEETGRAAGAVMAKVALNWGGLAKTVGGWAMKNPGTAGAVAGAGLGAAGGALAGGPGHRLSGAAGGALGGAALGGAASGVGGRMVAGQGLGQAAKNTAHAGVNAVTRGGNMLASRLPGSVGTPMSGVVQRAGDAAQRGLNAMAG
jgi:hypothetical protein